MTHEQNERLLTLLSEYLCFQPDAIAPADVAAFSADAHLPQEGRVSDAAEREIRA